MMMLLILVMMLLMLVMMLMMIAMMLEDAYDDADDAYDDGEGGRFCVSARGADIQDMPCTGIRVRTQLHFILCQIFMHFSYSRT